MSGGPADAAWLRVWDPLRRALHWILALAVLVAWWTAGDADGPWHLRAGYLAAGVVVLRLGWGVWCGPRAARIGRDLRAPRQLTAYLRALRAGRARRRLGHNPLGSLMVLSLLATTALVALTGWLYTTDRFWGYGWLASLHEALAVGLACLAGAHGLAALLGGRRTGDGLIRAMVDGRKRRRPKRGP